MPTSLAWMALAVAIQVAPTEPVEGDTAVVVRNRVLGTLADLAISGAGGMVGAGCGAAAGLSLPLVAAAGFTAFMVRRELPSGNPAFVRGAFIDGALFSLLFLMAGSPLVLLGALAGDAAGYAGVLAVARRSLSLRTVVPAAVALVATFPAVVVGICAGGVLLTWLGIQQLPDVLMVVALGGMAAAVVLGVVGILVVRPLFHGISTLAWLTVRE